MRPILGFSVFLIVLFLIDIYAWRGVQSALLGTSVDTTKKVKIIYWAISAILMVALLVLFGGRLIGGRQAVDDVSTFFLWGGIWFLFLFPKITIVLFQLLSDLYGFILALVAQFQSGESQAFGELMGRGRFLSQIGLGLSAIPFAAILYGITKGRSAFQVEHVDINNPRIPKAFDGFKIVQISDMHLGSLAPDNELVPKGVKLINELKPDLILFTGDMVNDLAIEATKWLGHLSQLEAVHGVYSVLGNHDYGDYFYGAEESAEKAANMKLLQEQQKEAGFNLMLDENTVIERGGESFRLIGVQNYGGGRFAKYGNLAKALQGVQNDEFKVLMSHDPSHWDLQVKDTDIDLTLSGHTHGMQFGFKYKGKRYSPVSMVYKNWAGLYQEKNQQLYVNRGFGYLGFPGRVGMSPEITLLTLRSA